MKKNLQTLLLSMCLLFCYSQLQAQTTVTVDGSGVWNGYMNVFDQAMNYQFGSSWGLPDVKSTVNAAANTVTLQPNFNTYANAATAADTAYWHNGPIGNKIMEANTYLESTSISNQNLTFDGTIQSNTLSSAYTATAFIKVLDPAMGYATIVNQTTPLPASGAFSVTAAIPATPGLLVQYGFTILGLNANPVDEVALGSIVAGPATPLPLSLLYFNASATNSTVNLNWATQDEINVDKFEILRSENGTDFAKISEVLAKNNAENFYSAQDNSVAQTSFYKLRITDIDGSESYSDMRKVIVQKGDVLKISPNPVTNIMKVTAAGTNSLKNTVIYNTTGSKLLELHSTNDSENIDISNLSPGLYYLQLQNGKSLKFIKH